MLTTVVFFIVGLSVILSFDWTSDTVRPGAETTILSGVLVGTIIFIAARLSSARGGTLAVGTGVCPDCGRSIPYDSLLCPYCGRRLP